jgi:hypothetical protein
MAQLKDSERREIVQRLAVFESPTEVAEWASEEFGKDVDRTQVFHYDPTRSDRTGQKWAELFEETRDAFLNDLDTIPLSHRAVRLRELTGLYKRAKEQDNNEKAARMLKQAAKEVGDAFTNRKEIEQDGDLTVEVVYTEE